MAKENSNLWYISLVAIVAVVAVVVLVNNVATVPGVQYEDEATGYVVEDMYGDDGGVEATGYAPFKFRLPGTTSSEKKKPEAQSPASQDAPARSTATRTTTPAQQIQACASTHLPNYADVDVKMTPRVRESTVGATWTFRAEAKDRRLNCRLAPENIQWQFNQYYTPQGYSQETLTAPRVIRGDGSSVRNQQVGTGASVTIDTSWLGQGRYKISTMYTRVAGNPSAYPKDSVDFRLNPRPIRLVVNSPINGQHLRWGSPVTLSVSETPVLTASEKNNEYTLEITGQGATRTARRANGGQLQPPNDRNLNINVPGTYTIQVKLGTKYGWAVAQPVTVTWN